MLGKWFKGKSAPTNSGKSEPDHSEKYRFIKVFELELTNMEDAPVYSLTHQLSIGSEIGNIIIADPSISPRHATFFLQDEIVSIIDHGSVAGTFVNGKKLDAGKKVILEETDLILVGDLEVRIKVGSQSVKEEVIPDLLEPGPESEVKLEIETLGEEQAPVDEVIVPEIKKPAHAPKVSQKPSAKKAAQKKKQSFALKGGPGYSTNAVIRVLAVLSDLLLAYSILVIFLPFDEFRMFLELVPEMIGTYIDLDWQTLLSMVTQDAGFAEDMLKDGLAFLSTTFHIVPLLIVFASVRLLSTFIFGVSISELFLGVRSSGNALWARLGGVLRVIVGFITWPLLIFDIPAIVSRRTFKEVITFTQTCVPSKFTAILGVLFYIPMMVAITALAPLFQGLDYPEPVLVNDKIEQRIKVKVPESEVGESTGTPVSDRSLGLNVMVNYSPEELSLLPAFKFQGGKNKLKVTSSLIFYQRELKRPVEFEVLKTFDLKQLLGIGMKGNVFLYNSYPEIYNYVYEPDEVNIAFRKTPDQKAQLRFANEVIQFTKTAFSLSVDNVVDFVQTESPMLKNFIDFRSSLLSLLEYKDFDQISFMKIGNAIFMKVSYQKQKPFDLLIPLIKGPGKIIKITFDKKESLGSVASKLYKFNLEKTNWLPEGKKESSEAMSALEVFDLFFTDNYKTLLHSSTKAQAFYAFYYETSASVLKRGDQVELEIWKNSVANMLKLIELMPAPQSVEGEDNTKEKLLQNLRDTADALENNNLEYFGVKATTSV